MAWLRNAGGLYTDAQGVFGDNQFRFALLSLAACEAPLVLNIGGHRCCFHNDMAGCWYYKYYLQ